MGDDAERERLLAEYERRTGTRPGWLDELKDEGLQWHLDQLDAPDDSDLTPGKVPGDTLPHGA